MPEPPAELVRDCPPDLSELVMQLLGKESGRSARRTRPRCRRRWPIFCTTGRCGSRRGRRPNSNADLAATVHPDRPNLTQRLHTHDSPAPLDCAGCRIIIAGLIAVAILATDADLR